MELFGTGHFLRSAEMEYVSLIMAEYLAHDVVARLGEVGSVQFTDMNGDMTAFKRHYTPYIRRCDELEKKLKFFEEEMTRHGVEPEEYSPAEFATWVGNQRDTLSREHRGLSLLDYWEAIINERHRDYTATKGERERTAALLYSTVQRRLVIEHAKDFFIEAAAGGFGSDVTSPPAGTAGSEPGARLVAGAGAASAPGTARDAEAGAGGAVADADSALRFRHIAGIISTEEKERFARIVFRASAGHAVVRFADVRRELLDDKGAPQHKSVFTVFYRGRTLGAKLDRICTAFSAHQHDIPSFADAASVRNATEETKRLMDDSLAWLRNEAASSETALRHLALLVRKWRSGVQREKAVYHVLNMFARQPERGTVSVHAWVLATEVTRVRESIQDAHAAAASGGRMQPYFFEVVRGGDVPQPPTHFPTNKVTKVFQGIVNTYGVPRYGEANPALFSIITFPFLFGVMYGDIGHATFITLAAGYILLRERHFGSRKLGEMFAMCFKGRYMLFMMGLFGIYCGLIYNDFFSIATSAFGGTRWVYPTITTNSSGTMKTSMATVAVKKTGDWNDVYTFGVDPTWHSADNDLLFFNSLKMKMAVVIGIIQMTFGLILKVTNAIHFKSKADLFLEAIPQLIFMVALFGYMVFLIILKWCIDWNDPATRPGAPPSLIDTLINVALKPGFVQDGMFPSQASLQVIILLIVFVTVPIMLFGKPLAAHFANKAAKAKAAAAGHEGEHSSLVVTANPAFSGAAGAGTGLASPAADKTAVAAPASAAHGDAHGSSSGGGHDHGHSFGDVFVHQAIETIEFVLGSVSNTASYLRLWALSLAHSQLATVFWERALQSQIETGNAFMVFVGWGAFAGVTIGVLLIMDVLECFLHALRLHWVEFQNKFFKADGYKFMPFSFAAIAEAED